MVKFALQMKAKLENIDELIPGSTNFSWILKFKCSNCGEKTEKWNYVLTDNEIPAQHGRDEHNLSSKCKFCARVNTASIVPASLKSYIADDQEKYQTIIMFECRGFEPCDFWPRDGWAVKVTNGKRYNEIDLSEGEYVSWCEGINQPIGVYEIEHKFERIK